MFDYIIIGASEVPSAMYWALCVTNKSLMMMYNLVDLFKMGLDAFYYILSSKNLLPAMDIREVRVGKSFLYYIHNQTVA